MQGQLPLPDARADWRLDDHTRELGRLGLAGARQALRAAAQREAVRVAERTRRPGQLPPCGPGAAAA